MNKISSKVCIVFSGYNQRSIIAFLRTLVANNLPFAIVAKSKEDPILYSSYSSFVFSTRKYIPLLLSDILECIKGVKDKLKADEYIIAPSTEALNRFLLENREEIESLSCKIPLVEKDIYESVSDKIRFSRICESAGILIPKEFENYEYLKYPFVAKPKLYFANDRRVHTPYLVFDSADKNIFLENCDPNDFYFQEYLVGRSYYLLYYFSRNGKVQKYSQENIAQQPGGKSIVAAISSNIHESLESIKYETLFKTMGFYGLVMVEIKEAKGKYYMIEANPRFWGPSQLFVDAGINLFETFLYDNGILSPEPIFDKIIKPVRYFWYGGIIEAQRNNKELTYYVCDKTKLIDELPLWKKSDIYSRTDTENIYNKELIK